MGRRKMPPPEPTQAELAADSATITQNPDWYKIELEGGYTDVREVADVLFTHNPHLWQAFKYIARAGRKPGTPYASDINKAINYLEHHRECLKKGHVPCVSPGKLES